jgi:hypothetical protein
MKSDGFRVAREPDGKLRFDKGRLGWFGGPLAYGAAFLLVAGLIFNYLCGFSGTITGSTGTSVNIPPGTLYIGTTWRGPRADASGDSWQAQLQVVKDNKVIASGIAAHHEPLSLFGVDYSNFSWRPAEARHNNSQGSSPVIFHADYSHNPGLPLIATALSLGLIGTVLMLIPRARVWCQVYPSRIAIRWEPTAPPSVWQLATIRDLLGHG